MKQMITVSPSLFDQVDQLLNLVRPLLASHGGAIDLISVEDRVVKVKMKGHCDGCILAGMTIKMGIQAVLKEKLPGLIDSVEAVKQEQDSVVKGNHE